MLLRRFCRLFGTQTCRPVAAASDRCLTSRRPHRLRFTPRMLMSGDPDGRQAIETCHGASHNSSFLQSRCGVSGRIFASHRRRRWRSVVVETRLIVSLLGFHAFNGRQAEIDADADANRYLAHRHPTVRAFAPCAAGVGIPCRGCGVRCRRGCGSACRWTCRGSRPHSAT